MYIELVRSVHVRCTMYYVRVHSSCYDVHRTMYKYYVQGTLYLYIVPCTRTMYYVHSTSYDVQKSTEYVVHCRSLVLASTEPGSMYSYIVLCTRYYVHRSTMYIVRCTIMYKVHRTRTRYLVRCTMYYVHTGIYVPEVVHRTSRRHCYSLVYYK